MQRVMSEEILYLKNVTDGEIHSNSLVFHFVHGDLNHVFVIKRVHLKSVNLR